MAMTRPISEQVTFTQEGAGAVERLTSEKLREWVSVKDFGAAGDGVTDDRAAIQNAVNAAGTVVFPPGTYRLTASTYDATANWRHHIVIPSNRTLLFEGGSTVVTTTPFASRAVAFLVRGSNVVIRGLTLTDDLTSASPFLVGVGCGTAYDSSYPAGTFQNLSVEDSSFNNNWLSVTVQFVATDSGNKFFEDVRVSNCVSRANAGASSSGNFNFRSDGPWKLRNVTVTGCVAYDGKTASSFNFYGVDGFAVNGCTSYRNAYAGCEMENGSQDGVVSNFRSIDDFWGVWVDDSRRIVINGVSHKTLTETFVSPLLGTQYRARDAIKLTRQGFTNYTGWVTEDIVVQGVVSEFGRITTGTFGSTPAGAFGHIVIDGFILKHDGTARTGGNTIVQIGGSVPEISLVNGRVIGAPTRSIEISTVAGGVYRLRNILTAVVAAESSTGLFTAGTGTLRLQDVNVHTQDLSNSVIEFLDYTVDGDLQPDRRAGQRFYYAVSGSPEGVLTAGPGSLAFRSDDGSIYVKNTGTGNTGWLRVATV